MVISLSLDIKNNNKCSLCQIPKKSYNLNKNID